MWRCCRLLGSEQSRLRIVFQWSAPFGLGTFLFDSLLLLFRDRSGFRAVLPICPPVLSILLSICPPVLSILPSILSTFDAPLVAGASGEKRASRRRYQSEQEQSCDPLSGNRGDGVFHTI